MNYTQTELEGMSDFELNKLMAVYFLPCDYVINEASETVELANYQDVMVGGMHEQVLTPYANYDPCNNWGDCGDLIDECDIAIYPIRESDYEIGTTWLTGEWMASAIKNRKSDEASMTDDLIQCKTDNPKRAVTIVYILIKQGES